jgi:hypothetical protein
LSTRGSLLSGYGKGIAAVAAGLADMRFVEATRDVKLPQEFAHDRELADAYYVSLDQALEPRKQRGRDAALVGLQKFASEGVLHDARVDEARRLLSRLYSGRRIDALDGLLLPDLPKLEAASPEQRLAARLPTFYAGLLLDPATSTDPAQLRALLERGLPVSARTVLAASQLSGPSRELYARGLLELGQRYWQAADFQRAAEQFPDLQRTPSIESALIAALAHTLLKGPSDAADMMRHGPFAPSALADVSALDSLANSGSSVAGLAAFDAAYILGLVPPAGNEPAFFRALAVRYRKAASQLKNAEQHRLATEHARAAELTAKAVR